MANAARNWYVRVNSHGARSPVLLSLRCSRTATRCLRFTSRACESPCPHNPDVKKICVCVCVIQSIPWVHGASTRESHLVNAQDILPRRTRYNCMHVLASCATLPEPVLHRLLAALLPVLTQEASATRWLNLSCSTCNRAPGIGREEH